MEPVMALQVEDPNYMYLDVGEGNVRNGGLAWDNSQNSYFGRLNYDYNNRYLLTAIVRQRWFFPFWWEITGTQPFHHYQQVGL
ncbi:MAG: hypothetical protein WKG06_14920 [Segetibacter sp.]